MTPGSRLLGRRPGRRRRHVGQAVLCQHAVLRLAGALISILAQPFPDHRIHDMGDAATTAHGVLVRDSSEDKVLAIVTTDTDITVQSSPCATLTTCQSRPPPPLASSRWASAIPVCRCARIIQSPSKEQAIPARRDRPPSINFADNNWPEAARTPRAHIPPASHAQMCSSEQVITTVPRRHY